jgi:hypothetical protein
MKEHPTIAEIRRIRRIIAAEHGYDPQNILEMLKASREKHLLMNKVSISDSEQKDLMELKKETGSNPLTPVAEVAKLLGKGDEKTRLLP